MNLEILVTQLNLGMLVSSMRIPGGRLHEIWKVETDQGVYAVKVLNPVRVNDQDLNRYRATERIATAMKLHGVPTSPALPFNGDVVYNQGQEHALIFPWIEGEVRAVAQDKGFAHKLGELLAQIHSTKIPYDPGYPSSTSYVSQDISRERSWIFSNLPDGIANPLSHAQEMIDDIQKQSLLLKSNPLNDKKDCVLSHRDLDPSNVMIIKEGLIPIDWELAGYIEPCYDLMLTALYAARNTSIDFDWERMKACIEGYNTIRPIPNPNQWEQAWIRVLEGWLDWLHFNLTRANKLSNSISERSTGIAEAEKILHTIGMVYRSKTLGLTFPDIFVIKSR